MTLLGVVSLLNLSKFIKNLTAVANNEFQSTLIASVALNFNLIK